jgi:UDP-2-acetamido-3-amino-2,3-dideoxy-glucuronate N-acetyltransferase
MILKVLKNGRKPFPNDYLELVNISLAKNSVIEDGVQLSEGVTVWDFSKIRTGCVIGKNTSIGVGVYIGPGVTIGSNCRIQNGAQIFEPAVLEDNVFIGPNAVLTNHKYPTTLNEQGSPISESDWTPLGVTVKNGAKIGASSTIIAGVTIGAGALIAAGAIITKDVPDNSTFMGVAATIQSS